MAQEDDHSLDLFWHALNYRTAAPQHAELMWRELEACVERMMEDAQERERESARDWHERHGASTS